MRVNGWTPGRVLAAAVLALVFSLNEALRVFTRESVGADMALVFYAGHGLEVDSVNYLVPVDARLERDTDVRSKTGALDDVLAATAGASLRMVILDACRNNPLARSMQRTVARRSVSGGSFGDLNEARRRRRRVAGPAAVNRARGAAARGPVRPGELDAGRPEGPLRADGRAARRAEPAFGRFEAFFLPAARWEQVREAFWARTGFHVEPTAAVEQLKARLSDAFDRFLEGVADNRQVAFDDDGWRLKTDAAEQPDPAQSDRLAELTPLAGRPQPHDPAGRPAHRGRERPRVQRPLPATRGAAGRPRGGVRAARRDPRPRLQPRPLHHGEGRPRHRLQAAQVRQRLASRRGEPAGRARRHRPRHLPPRRRRPLGRRHDVGQRRAALRHAPQGAAADLQHPLQRLRARVLLLRRRQLRPVSTAARSSAPTATRPSCSTACSTTRATSTSKSTTPTPTATPRSTSRGLRDGRHAVLPAYPQPAPPADLLRRPGPSGSPGSFNDVGVGSDTGGSCTNPLAAGKPAARHIRLPAPFAFGFKNVRSLRKGLIRRWRPTHAVKRHDSQGAKSRESGAWEWYTEYPGDGLAAIARSSRRPSAS